MVAIRATPYITININNVLNENPFINEALASCEAWNIKSGQVQETKSPWVKITLIFQEF